MAPNPKGDGEEAAAGADAEAGEAPKRDEPKAGVEEAAAAEGKAEEPNAGAGVEEFLDTVGATPCHIGTH